MGTVNNVSEKKAIIKQLLSVGLTNKQIEYLILVKTRHPELDRGMGFIRGYARGFLQKQYHDIKHINIEVLET
jgi:hypothetical protein